MSGEPNRPEQKRRAAVIALAVAAGLSYAGLFFVIFMAHATVPEIIAWFGVTAFGYRWGIRKLGH